MNGFRVFQHLLPQGRAWSLTLGKRLREFFQGLTGLPEDTVQFFDLIFQDLDPQKTRDLASWEKQFGLMSTVLTEQERRDRLSATWAALGGQDPQYLQGTLQAAGFDVFIHEWWEPIGGRSGGSVNNDVTPVARNPFDFLDDGTGLAPFTMVDGGADAQDGDSASQDGGTNVPVGYPLVNRISEAFDTVIGDGSAEMQDGNAAAQDGGQSVTQFRFKNYVIPADPTKYPFFLYIGGETFPNTASIPEARRTEFEELCLKICPTEQWLGILVTFT